MITATHAGVPLTCRQAQLAALQGGEDLAGLLLAAAFEGGLALGASALLTGSAGFETRLSRASLENGLLTVSMPKSEQSKPKKIQIKAHNK